jgi:hypothetical protein
MWFGKAVEDFNRGIQEAGSNAPQLIASTSNGFTSMFFCTLEPERTISHPCSGLGRLRVLCCSCHLCFDPATRNSRWQVLVIRKLYVFKLTVILILIAHVDNSYTL